MKPVILGIENLVANHSSLVRDKNVGLVAHPASIDSRFEHTWNILVSAGARVHRLFGPEHGFAGEAQDMEPVDEPAGNTSGPPLVSLYGAREETLAPKESDLADLDLLVVDLADVGSRYYTFVWTALLSLRVCARVGIPMILTDRPNPIGGKQMEGPLQEEGFLSFVGLAPLPNRHGLTPGEILTYCAQAESLTDHLEVIPMLGWQRKMHYGDTDLPWVMPSPNMPTPDTALVYPGMCLLEATWASEGRGTTRPFELFGAPGVDPSNLVSALEEHRLPGVRFRPASFKPMFQKHAETICGGAQMHVVDKDAFAPYRTGLAVLSALSRVATDQFQWRREPYEFVEDIPAIDLLTGSSRVRIMIEEGASPSMLKDFSMALDEEFSRSIEEIHLY